MNVEPVAWPRLDPRKSIIFEQESWRDPITRDPTVMEVSPDFPDHEKAKRDSEKNQRCDIDLREGARLQLIHKAVVVRPPGFPVRFQTGSQILHHIVLLTRGRPPLSVRRNNPSLLGLMVF